MGDQFDLFSGSAARDEGMDRVADSNPTWMALGVAAILGLPKGWRGLGEDIRVLVEAKAGPPKHPNATGALVSQAKRLGLLRATGRRLPMRRVTSHARKTDEYER